MQGEIYRKEDGFSKKRMLHKKKKGDGFLSLEVKCTKPPALIDEIMTSNLAKGVSRKIVHQKQEIVNY